MLIIFINCIYLLVIDYSNQLQNINLFEYYLQMLLQYFVIMIKRNNGIRKFVSRIICLHSYRFRVVTTF